MDDLGSRLKKLREAKKLTQQQVADEIGVSRVAVTKWENGQTSNIKFENLLSLSELFEISVEKLIRGDKRRGKQTLSSSSTFQILEHPQEKNEQETTQPPPELTNIEKIEIDVLKKDVPLISWVQAGDWCEAINNFESGDAEKWLPCPTCHSEKTFALRVRGISMFNPDGDYSFKEGEIIYVDPERQPLNGSFVVVRLEDKNEVTFKQLIIEGEHKYLQAINPDWPKKIIEIDGNATICGVVIYAGREL